MILLDLYCGAGGAAMGYNRAGFDVVGIDIEPQPRYPFKFIQADVLEWMQDFPSGFDAIHASPPCQRHSALIRGGHNDKIDDYPELIKPTRHLIHATGLPYVIENVPGAPLDKPYITLCGEMYGLDVIRHRIFETNWPLAQPKHIPHRGRVDGWRNKERIRGPYVGVYGHGGGKGTLEDWREAMDVWWMETRPEMVEAIPPAYTEYIGTELMKFLTGGDHEAAVVPASQRAEAYCTQCGRRTRPDLANPGLPRP